jgi:hypothetical protein
MKKIFFIVITTALFISSLFVADKKSGRFFEE